jgi:cytochrome c oxidase subunit 3
MSDETLKQQRRRAKKPLLWVAQASIFMAFAGLTSGFLVSKGTLEDKGLWMEFALPTEFLISTILILLSSASLIMSAIAIRQNNSGLFKTGVVVAFLLGIGFVLYQLLGWSDLTERGIYFTGEGSNTSGSWIYAITFFHLLHLAGGMIALFVTMVNALRGLYSGNNKLGFELASIFWHFLGAVWLYLYLFLNFVR